MIRFPTARLVAFLFLISAYIGLEPAHAEQAVDREQFAGNVSAFLQKEITAHAEAVTNLDPPQKMVLGVPTAGDFMGLVYARRHRRIRTHGPDKHRRTQRAAIPRQAGSD